MAHTPGPWNYDYGLVPPDGPHRYSEVTVEGGNHIIANVNEFLDGHENGNLISAAPELLASCKDVYEWCCKSSFKPPATLLERLWESIKKAEGRK